MVGMKIMCSMRISLILVLLIFLSSFGLGQEDEDLIIEKHTKALEQGDIIIRKEAVTARIAARGETIFSFVT